MKFRTPPTRRLGLGAASFAAAVAIVFGSWSCRSRPDAAPAATVPSGELAYLGVDALQERMEAGTLTSARLVQSCIDRIAAIDSAGPELRSVIEVNPDAIEIARALDAERAATGPRGPLHGIPVLLKANIDTGDTMATSAGSLALAGHRADDDAFLVTALRESGAVILGKTNLSEWANFRSSESTSGWSSLGGQTRNPHAPDRNPCGSSSGSAVAVAAGLTPLAVGTETDGSIVCPAGVNGVVGVKPTVGLVSRDGIIPIAISQDTAGPMARSVRDAALLLGAMAEPDDDDPGARPLHPGRDFTGQLTPDALRGKRVGVLRRHYGAGDDPRVEAHFSRVIELLQELGATVVDPVALDVQGDLYRAEFEVLLYEFNDGINRYLASAAAQTPGVPSSLAGLIAFNHENAAEVMPWFGQETLERAAAVGSLDEPGYAQALAASRDAMQQALGSHLIDADDEERLDTFIAPTNGPAWVTDPVLGDRHSLGSSSYAAISGWPSVTLPAGTVHGLPVGVSLIGAPDSEAELLGFAYALEQGLAPAPRPGFD